MIREQKGSVDLGPRGEPERVDYGQYGRLQHPSQGKPPLAAVNRLFLKEEAL
jgi:hypothetical protein